MEIVELPESTFNKIIDIAKDFYDKQSIMPDYFCELKDRAELSEKDLDEKWLEWRTTYAITNTLNVIQAASEVAIQIQERDIEQNPVCDKYKMSPFSNECQKCGHEDIKHNV